MRLNSSGAVIGILLLTVIFLATGCDSPTSSGPSSRGGEGTLYQIQGFVLDSTTGQPLEGVTVEIDSGRSATTNASGTYLIKDVIPNLASTNTYNLSIWKKGYEAKQQVLPSLSATLYLTDDPFYKKAVLSNLLAAFNEWVKKQEIPTDGSSVTNSGWTYTGAGTFVNSEGGSVTYNEAGGTFDWNLPRDINYTYSYGVGMPVIQMSPLIGGLTGKINVVFAEKDSDSHAAAASIKDDVEVWVTVSGKNYGPVLTKDGMFSIEGLPATGIATVNTNGFTQEHEGTKYFFDGVSGTTKITSPSIPPGAGSSSIAAAPGKFITRIDDLYVFKAPNIAFIASANVGAGKAGEPIGIKTPITLSFTKDINKASFTAFIDTDSDGSYSAGNDYALAVAWDSTDAKKVTLTVSANPAGSNHTYPHLPYAAASSSSIGKLIINGKAVDGSVIAKNDLPVYTEIGLKLVKTEVVASPPARLAVATGNAVKFTFSKNIEDSPMLAFYEYDNSNTVKKKLSHKVQDKEVYVYIDTALNASTDRIGYRNIAAKGDADDMLANADTGAGSLVDISSNIEISLRATNLYKPDADRAFADRGTDPSGTEAYFPVGGNITLTFTSLPSGAKAYAELNQAGAVVPAAVTVSGDTLTINPASDLGSNTAYTIGIKVLLNGRDIFKTGLIPSSVAAVSGGLIRFTTRP
jgi:hypothetical protein